MSRAFVKDADETAFELLPERAISPHRNLVTPAGLAAMDAEIAHLRAAQESARAANDNEALARIGRDLRYWSQRHASAQVQPAPEDNGEVQFGASVTIARADGAEETYRIVGEDEADPARGTVSYVSPMAQALMGKSEGDIVRVAGKTVRVLRVS
jgi:transcription elongation GreA/GreB family factor